jgi:hypothetical protein
MAVIAHSKLYPQTQFPFCPMSLLPTDSVGRYGANFNFTMNSPWLRHPKWANSSLYAPSPSRRHANLRQCSCQWLRVILIRTGTLTKSRKNGARKRPPKISKPRYGPLGRRTRNNISDAPGRAWVGLEGSGLSNRNPDPQFGLWLDLGLVRLEPIGKMLHLVCFSGLKAATMLHNSQHCKTIHLHNLSIKIKGGRSTQRR